MEKIQHYLERVRDSRRDQGKRYKLSSILSFNLKKRKETLETHYINIGKNGIRTRMGDKIRAK